MIMHWETLVAVSLLTAGVVAFLTYWGGGSLRAVAISAAVTAALAPVAVFGTIALMTALILG